MQYAEQDVAEMNKLQALLVLSGEDWVDVVTFTNEQDPLDLLEALA